MKPFKLLSRANQADNGRQQLVLHTCSYSRHIRHRPCAKYSSTSRHHRHSSSPSSMSTNTLYPKPPSMQRSLPAVYYRGGTSRAAIVKPTDLPPSKADWPPIFLRLLGSPDPYARQLDGLGGAGISSLSKICVVGPSGREDADVDYTFFAVGIREDEVDDSGNCGNMSSAVGPFAYEEGMVPTHGASLLEPSDAERARLSLHDEDRSTAALKEVVVHNTNTGKLIRSRFPVSRASLAPIVAGTYRIDGVGHPGAPISLDFLYPGGAKTGKLLPTGNAVDVICGVRASCVDAANPCVFVNAEDMGVDGVILPDELLANGKAMALLESIRTEAAVRMGMANSSDKVPRAIPKVGIMSPAKRHVVLSGEEIREEDVDIVARVMSDRQPHRAIPLTAALCTATAAQVEGSIVQECLSKDRIDKGIITIGHTSGKIQVSATKNGEGVIECATVYRTARRIMEGRVFY